MREKTDFTSLFFLKKKDQPEATVLVNNSFAEK